MCVLPTCAKFEISLYYIWEIELILEQGKTAEKTQLLAPTDPYPLLHFRSKLWRCFLVKKVAFMLNGVPKYLVSIPFEFIAKCIVL